ncbi:hypothetical protein THIAE_08065 [Thiomicrospira aerophila AL3]|uniref:Uncharacterized protein n=1 Tax=Thiomicrospira aerophila AL3 TaxID=717772 RepID=W0DTG4_9GAMM|nr:hypothetical protein [Thiomicrospira aerophila]AHF01717.1 hypothetical protein THIAE_08065 [Thiomicrospira aerophila AL3]
MKKNTVRKQNSRFEGRLVAGLVAWPLAFATMTGVVVQASEHNSDMKPSVSDTSAATTPLVIQIESVVMGTDGQMRVRVNGQYLTRHSERDGIRVLDMNYDQVQVQAQGQTFWLKPHHTLTLENLEPTENKVEN